MLSGRERERLRRRYRPEVVRVLFIGEAPPASGRFFYRGDSGFYRAMREAFQAVDSEIGEETFLAAFEASGCYFVDLCAEPVDRLDARSRREAWRAGEAGLARAVRRLRPAMMVTVVRSIEGNVKEAARRAGWRGTTLHVPYPGRWAHLKRAFVEGLTPVIAGLLADVPEGYERPGRNFTE